MVAVVHGMLAHHRETYKGEGNAAVVRLLGREVCSDLLAYVIVGAEVQSMENTITTAVFLKSRSDYKAAIERYLAEMQRLHEQMARDQQDIDRLRAAAKALVAELQAA